MGGLAFEQLLRAGGLFTTAELRNAFASAAALAADYGSGWETPPAGQLSFFGFVEALLTLAPRVPLPDDPPSDPPPQAKAKKRSDLLLRFERLLALAPVGACAPASAPSTAEA